MMQPIHNAEGELVQVLDVADLNDAKTWFIQWLLGILVAVVLMAVSIGVYATKLQAKDDVLHTAQDNRMQRHEAQLITDAGAIAELRLVKAQLDSLRIETRHIADVVDRTERTVRRVAR